MSRHLSPSLTSSSTPRRGTAAPQRGRGLAATAGLLLAVPLAAGCGAGFNAASQQVKANSGAGSIGAMKVNDVWVVVDPTTGNAEIVGAVANTGTSTDSLVSVSATNLPATLTGTDASSATTGISVSGSSVAIPAGQSVSFGETGQPALGLSDANFQAGLLSQVTFTFAQAGAVTVTAQIQPDTGVFAGYSPDSAVPPKPTTPPPTPSASATANPSGTATPSGTPSSTVSATSTHS